MIYHRQIHHADEERRSCVCGVYLVLFENKHPPTRFDSCLVVFFWRCIKKKGDLIRNSIVKFRKLKTLIQFFAKKCFVFCVLWSLDRRGSSCSRFVSVLPHSHPIPQNSQPLKVVHFFLDIAHLPANKIQNENLNIIKRTRGAKNENGFICFHSSWFFWTFKFFVNKRRTFKAADAAKSKKELLTRRSDCKLQTVVGCTQSG